MQNKSRAFTLIELLVVVLIIGILAAVAVPQYQLAVEKSRLGSLRAIAKTIQQAQDSYYLDTGSYTSILSQLPVSLPYKNLREFEGYSIVTLPDGSEITISTSSLTVKNKSNAAYYLMIFYEHGGAALAGKTTCYAKMNNAFANKVCQSLTGKAAPDTGNGPDTVNIYFF